MSIQLNGVNQAVNLDAHGAALDFNASPFALYLEFSTISSGTMFLYLHGRTTGNGEYGFWISNGDLLVRFNAGDPVEGSVNYADGSLHRALFIWRSSNDALELWIDGSLVSSSSNAGTISEINNLTGIGYDPNGVLWFDGEMSNVAVWSTELTALDAADLTDNTIGVSGVTGTLVEHWPLDYDARGNVNGLDGLVVRTPTFTEDYPEGIPDSPVARYRASELSLIDNDPVTSWPDESLHGAALAQATVADQPVYNADAAFGSGTHPAVEFDGISDFMQVNFPGFSLSQPNTVVIMGEWITKGTSPVYMFDGISAARHAVFWTNSPSPDAYRMFAGTGTGVASETPLAGEDICLVALFNGTSSDLFENNVDIYSDVVDLGTNNLGGFTLARRFADSGGENHGNLRVVEVLIYPRALDSTERTAVFNYFSTTYIGAVVQNITPDVLSPVSFPAPALTSTLVPNVLSPASFPEITITQGQTLTPSTLEPVSFPQITLTHTLVPNTLSPVSFPDITLTMGNSIVPDALEPVSFPELEVVLAVQNISPATLDPVTFPPIFIFVGDFEPILAGTGTIKDMIMQGLITQGFTTGSIADRERDRLRSKIGEPIPDSTPGITESIADLYVLAQETPRLPLWF